VHQRFIAEQQTALDLLSQSSKTSHADATKLDTKIASIRTTLDGRRTDVERLNSELGTKREELARLGEERKCVARLPICMAADDEMQGALARGDAVATERRACAGRTSQGGA